MAAVLLAVPAIALAQSLPGLAPQPEAPSDPTWLQGLWAWLQVQQAALRRELVELLGALRAGDNAALGGLLLGSILYGVVHAAGPGHGKLIISSYLFANGNQVRSGLGLTAVSSLLQALSAIALVAVLAYAIDRARLQVARDVQLLEIGSYALIVLLGFVMLWRALRRRSHAHHRHQHGHDHKHGEEHHHHHGWSAPAGAIPRRDFWAMAFSIGIRPCSGAVIVLLFTFGQGLVLAGIGATLAMAVGTALTVAALALLAIGSRHLALRLAGPQSALAGYLGRGFAVVGALAVVGLGGLFLWVAWSEPPPL